MASFNDIASAIISVSSVLTDYSNAKAEQEAQQQVLEQAQQQQELQIQMEIEEERQRELTKQEAEAKRQAEEEAKRQRIANMTPQERKKSWESTMQIDYDVAQLRFYQRGIYTTCQHAIYNTNAFKACGTTALVKFNANQNQIYKNEYKWASQHNWEYRKPSER